MHVTVPPLPASQTGWRKTLTSLTDAKGGSCVEGRFLQPADVVDLPAGTLLVQVDKVTVRWEYAYGTRNRVPVQEVTVTAHLTGPDGLTQLWTRHFKTASSAFGQTTRKKLAAVLAAHPAPAGEVTVVEEARRPNRRDGECRWCTRRVAAETGHVVGHGDTAAVEHWKTCPTREAYVGTVEIGVTCGLCGGVLLAQGGYRAPDSFALVMVREGEGRWEARHAPHVRCTERRPESAEEARDRVAAAREAERAEYRAQREAERGAEEKKAARKATRLERERAAEAAETARVAGLTRTGRKETVLNDKGIGGPGRIKLVEYLDQLSDGTTTTRWGVVRYYGSGGYSYNEDADYGDLPGESSEFTSKRDAQAAYRKVKFTPVRHPDSAGSADTCANGCGGTGRHDRQDSSGIGGRVCSSCNREPDYILSFA